ncbi:unnamed protein product [Ophioblennius macclurei]
MGEAEDASMLQAGRLFETFVQASTCKGSLQAFSTMCRQLQLDPLDQQNFYFRLKDAVRFWKVQALWSKLDKRAQHKVYSQGGACRGTRCLVIGGGPCGLRTAIELRLLGCQVVLMEKRDSFSRNNVLHLWPFTIHDLRGLGAKHFYGKFCAGSIDHISIRQLQLMLLKVCLILGVEVHVNVEFVKLLEPPEEPDGAGWRAEVQPSSHTISDFDFDVVIGADGRKNTLEGFSRKEFRGKLAIAITANFVNRNSTAEAKVEEISGVAFIFNQKFFLELREETGIDLENIVYYKDHTHYFVMTAKKQSLLEKGVIVKDLAETERLLAPDNVAQAALLSYARQAADFATDYQLPSLDFAINHYGQPDVAMFDFTSMYASENAALIREKRGRSLLVALVGDSLLEPFWPMGTGCARGFLAAFDTAWMVRRWVEEGRSPLEVLAERESLYRLLPQTTTENISKHFEQYSIDPASRYPNLNSCCVRPHQVRHLFINGLQDSAVLDRRGPTRGSVSLSRRDSMVRPGRLLTWCQRQTEGYRGVQVRDLSASWRSGLALCALIHRQRPQLIDFDSLNEDDSAGNNQLAFDVAEREFGIQPVTTGAELAEEAEPDKLLMVLYLSKFYQAFRDSPVDHASRHGDENGEDVSSGLVNLPHIRKRTPRGEKKLQDDSEKKRRRKGNSYLSELSCHSAPPAGENKVRSMATQLLAKFEENAPTGNLRSASEDDSYDSPPVSCSSTPVVSEEEEDQEKEEEEQEEQEEDRENPRFAQPKALPPPPPAPPPRPKWQPSVYLRLLEDPSSVTSSGFSSSPFGRSSSSPPTSRPQSPLNPGPLERFYPECTSPSPPDGSEEPSQQTKTLSAGEFSRRSIQERASLLSCMFPGSPRSAAPPPAPPPVSPPPAPPPVSPSAAPPPVSQVDSSFSSSSFSSSSSCASSSCSSPTPPALSLPKSSSVYPAVHPVPNPVTQAGFSSGDKDKTAPPFFSSSSRSSSCTSSSESVASVKLSSCADLEPSRGTPSKSVARTVSCPSGAPRYAKERTIGKVSSSIDAKAQLLAIMYETDHRPNATPSVARKGGAGSGGLASSGFGGSDVCHFCAKRVYVMERLSAEGFFFHRHCFRCHVCHATLRLGGHAYDSRDATFYCKMHYAQRQSAPRRPHVDQHSISSSSEVIHPADAGPAPSQHLCTCSS